MSCFLRFNIIGFFLDYYQGVDSVLIQYLLIIVFILLLIFYHPTQEKKLNNYLVYLEKIKEKSYIENKKKRMNMKN
ncbi:MAG: hypothetical protein ACOC3B_02290 [Bacillota bacterium]